MYIEVIVVNLDSEKSTSSKIIALVDASNIILVDSQSDIVSALLSCAISYDVIEKTINNRLAMAVENNEKFLNMSSFISYVSRENNKLDKKIYNRQKALARQKLKEVKNSHLCLYSQVESNIIFELMMEMTERVGVQNINTKEDVINEINLFFILKYHFTHNIRSYCKFNRI